MKRFIAILMVVIALAFLVLVLALNSNAAETVPEEPIVESLPSGDNTVDTSFFGRIGEYITSGRIFQAMAFLAAGAMLWAARSLKRFCSNMFGKISGSIKSGATVTKDAQEAVTEKLVEIEKKLSNVEDTNRKIETFNKVLADLLDMLDTIYQGSSTVPAVVKERVARKHDHAAHLLEGEENET